MFSSLPAWDTDRKYQLDRLAVSSIKPRPRSTFVSLQVYYENRDRHELKRLSIEQTLLEVLQLPG